MSSHKPTVSQNSLSKIARDQGILPMDTIQKKRAQRFLYLKRLYEKAEGSTFPDFVFTEIGRELGWTDSVINEVADYLIDEGLIEFLSIITVKLTHRGLKFMEEALSAPDRPTQYFPPANIIIMVNGDFTVGGDVIGRDKTTTGTTG